MATTILTSLDMAQNELLYPVIHVLGSAPGSPVTGQIYFNSTLGELGYYTGSAWVYPGSTGGGSVTAVTVTTANGFAGTVATDTTTPAITISTSVTGLLKGNGTGVSAAALGTDYAPATSGTSILKGSGSGGFSNAASGTDYAPATTGTGILKGNGSGAFNTAAAGTDYLAPSGSGAALTGITVSQVSGAAPTASPTFTGTVTVPTPTTTGEAATKGYVDSAIEGLDTKPSVIALAGSNITLSGTQTVDGISLTAGMRVLAVGQTTTTQNGIWVVASSAWTRPTDFATTTTQQGAYTFVEAGTVYASTGWVMVGDTAITVDTTAQTWTQFSSAGSVTAGTGLTKSGTTLSLTAPVTVALGGTNATTIAGAKTSLGFSQIYNSGLTLGNGTLTTIDITHNLNNSYPVVQVWNSSGDVVICDVATVSANAIALTFSVAPASDTIACVVVG